MSTRAFIAYNDQKGTITATYCHSDGYPEHTGKTLRKYYNEESLAEEVSKGGYYSFLYSTVEESIEESLNKDIPYIFDSMEELIEEAAEGGLEYIYLWQDGKWQYMHCDGREWMDNG